ncbi:UNVERIFIED_CONTAM: helix-turn-helix transcriptional regulator [Kocuria sp. CPCC 205274]|uniref:Helix-turn-helix domain-containing protein n=1 Tax=Herbiconiux daphne TaxID=2970914 RepID=A0ABT2HBB4_9MICO|nr:helix-turn-helix transcriptional regulator [Herbiconiux daphne]MCS5737240.1 helix-turn-helix domain-containing protein [Herbiconiux daphne]
MTKSYRLARRLANFRIDALDMTQEQLANLQGVPTQNISAFENGRSTNVNYLFLYIEACNHNQELLNELLQHVYEATK